MSDNENEDEISEKPFYIERAKTGRANCKKCKKKIEQGELRFAKLGYNPFGNGTMKLWHHIPCIFEVFKKQRASTKKIEHPDDIGDWDKLTESDKQVMFDYFSPELIKIFKMNSCKKYNVIEKDKSFFNHKDNSLKIFTKICKDISNDSSYLQKTKIISNFFDKGSDGDFFKGDVQLWCKLLLPDSVIRVYNLQSKQLIKLFSKILRTNQDEMLEDLEKGDVAETISKFFKKSKIISEAKKSTLTLFEVDNFLEDLSKMTKEQEQINHFEKILNKCTINDLKIILRLVKHDLRINAGPKHILEALHKDAYEAFQTSRDLTSVVKNAMEARAKEENACKKDFKIKNMDIGINLMTPILPMLAQACKSVEMAFLKCPNGIFSEIKYDGERVQLHKQGDQFKYFSRSLKPVLSHKVDHFKKYISQAFPHGKDLILDAEILMVDKHTGQPLPFGTLGIHKKEEFTNANVCLFVFDCMYYNKKSLLKTPLKERKDILKKNMVEVKNRIMHSEMEEIYKAKDLKKMINKVFSLGLEGLVIKDVKSIYEPGKRHWLKVKKDYLDDGAIAESADLVVLGAWFGTGLKGGLMSSFLMGCYDSMTKKWMTVTKVSNGHDDQTLKKIQKELDVIKISKDVSKLPSWLLCTKTMVPDFVAVDPKKMPVWQITGAEFTCNQIHTADGISIRFPRVTRIRSDKNWKTATTLMELKELYEFSKTSSNFSVSSKSSSWDEDSIEKIVKVKPLKKRQRSSSSNTKIHSKRARPEECSVLQEDTNTDDFFLQNKAFEIAEAKLYNRLPNIFTNCVLQFSKEYKDYELLRRYLIAYGAILYDFNKNTALENSKNKVTHVVHLTNSSDIKVENYWAKDVRHVHINWLWDSIKLLEKQPEFRYRVIAENNRT